jgi:hypothetical protein
MLNPLQYAFFVLVFVLYANKCGLFSNHCRC